MGLIIHYEEKEEGKENEDLVHRTQAAQEKPARAGMERKDGESTGRPWLMAAFLELNLSHRKGRLVHTKLWKDGSRGVAY